MVTVPLLTICGESVGYMTEVGITSFIQESRAEWMKKISLLAIALILIVVVFFFAVPTIETNWNGQEFFLGQAIIPPPADELHCLVHESLSHWLFGVGYYKIGGCP